jgi:hypothetical protein
MPPSPRTACGGRRSSRPSASTRSTPSTASRTTPYFAHSSPPAPVAMLPPTVEMLTSLVIGSEGTLGVVVAATLKLRRLVPGHARTLTATFPDVRAASASAAAPSVCTVSCARPGAAWSRPSSAWTAASDAASISSMSPATRAR